VNLLSGFPKSKAGAILITLLKPLEVNESARLTWIALISFAAKHGLSRQRLDTR